MWNELSYFDVSITLRHKAASLADSSPAPVPLPLRVEPKLKSGIRQQDLLKKVVEVKPKKPKVSDESTTPAYQTNVTAKINEENVTRKTDEGEGQLKTEETKTGNPLKSLLGLAYGSSDDEEE
ncbi:unnamed protein product [Rhodiola kirilowii]